MQIFYFIVCLCRKPAPVPLHGLSMFAPTPPVMFAPVDVWVQLFFAVNVDVPAAPADQPEPNPAAQQAPNPAAPPIAPTPPAVRPEAEKHDDDENILRHMKPRKQLIVTKMPAPSDFEYVDCEGKKRRVVNGKIH